jgi:hypothetical protein
VGKYGSATCQTCRKPCALRWNGRLYTHRAPNGRVCDGVNQMSGLPTLNGHTATVLANGSIDCSCGEVSPVFSAARFRERWWGWHVGDTITKDG